MKMYLAFVTFLGLVVSTHAQECTISKEFRLKHPQSLSGTLLDPNGVALPGVGLELLTGRRVSRDIRTARDGSFDFGEIPIGKYRLHIRLGGDPLCAPRVICTRAGCRVDSHIQLNPKKSMTID